MKKMTFKDKGEILKNTFQGFFKENSFFHGAALSYYTCLLYTSPSPRDRQKSRMPSSA